MKINAKRILSFVLSCILICSGLQVATAEKENKLQRAKNLLSALHIIDDDTDALVTREQFADIFVRANNLYQEGYVGANPFDDTEDSDYAESIHLMRDLGYINGVGDNLFAPLDNMLTNDIAKLYVSALGLDTYSGATGKDYMSKDLKPLRKAMTSFTVEYQRCFLEIQKLQCRSATESNFVN